MVTWLKPSYMKDLTNTAGRLGEGGGFRSHAKVSCFQLPSANAWFVGSIASIYTTKATGHSKYMNQINDSNGKQVNKNVYFVQTISSICLRILKSSRTQKVRIWNYGLFHEQAASYTMTVMNLPQLKAVFPGMLELKNMFNWKTNLIFVEYFGWHFL